MAKVEAPTGPIHSCRTSTRSNALVPAWQLMALRTAACVDPPTGIWWRVVVPTDKQPSSRRGPRSLRRVATFEEAAPHRLMRPPKATRSPT